MLVASGVLVAAWTHAMAGIPSTGSSRYSSSPSRRGRSSSVVWTRAMRRWGSMRSGASGNAAPQRLETGDLRSRLQDAGLELQGTKTVLVHHAPRLLDQRLRCQHFAPGIRFATIRMAGELVEEVGRERNRLAHLPAEQIAHCTTGGFAERIPAGNLDRADNTEKVAAFRVRQGLPRPGPEPVEVGDFEGPPAPERVCRARPAQAAFRSSRRGRPCRPRSAPR